MKKWILLLVAVLVSLLWVMASLYVEINKELDIKQTNAINIAKKQTSIQTVSHVERYYGENAYQVIHGKTKKGHSIIVWVPEDKGKVIYEDASKGLSEADVRNLILTSRNPKEIIDIRLGAIKKQPVWEVTYVDFQNRYTFFYMDFYTGNFIKRYSLNKGDFKWN